MSGPLRSANLAGPFDWLAHGWQLGVCAALVVATIGLATVLERWAVPLNASVERGILALELPWSAQRAGEVRQKFEADGVLTLARRHIALDFAFLLVYPCAIALACTLLAGTIQGSGAATIGIAIAWAVLLAAPLDAVENAAMLRMLAGHTFAPWPQLSSACAAVKFALVAGGLLFIAVAVVARVAQAWRG